jgi:hypothetical protein
MPVLANICAISSHPGSPGQWRGFLMSGVRSILVLRASHMLTCAVPVFMLCRLDNSGTSVFHPSSQRIYL